jgi:hypothetical protein
MTQDKGLTFPQTHSDRQDCFDHASIAKTGRISFICPFKPKPANFCPLCHSKVHSTLGEHLEAKEAVGFESEQGKSVHFNKWYLIAEPNAGLEIFEYVRAQKPGGLSGYQSLGGKLPTKNSLMKVFEGKVSG